MKKTILALLLSFVTVIGASAQGKSNEQIGQTDSIPPTYTPLTEVKPLTALLGVCVPVVAYDLFHLQQDVDVRGIRGYYAPSHHVRYDDVLMFAPLGLSWGMYLGGVKGRSDTFLEAFTAQGMTIAMETALVFGGKAITKRMRPDGSSANSFPSGHTAFAFASAAILDAEYGAEYPWLSLIGYTAATVTGVGRILNNRHWATDVVTGAGIGLGSAYLGYYLSDLIFRGKAVREDFFFPQSDAPWMFGIEKGYQTYLSSVGNYSADRIGMMTGLSVRIPLYKRWGFKVQGSLFESRNVALGEALEGYLLLAKADYMYPLWDGRIWIDGNAGAGYGSEMRLQEAGEAYETSAPFVTESLPLSVGAGATLSLLPNFGVRLGADYLYAFNARPYSRDTKKGMKGFTISLSLNYLLPR